MIDCRPAKPANRAVLLTVSCLFATLILSGCTDLKRAIGLEHTSPDEFAVESRAPLLMPPDYNLRPPTPGAPRPQDVPAADKARKVVDSAGPGDAGKQANYSLKPGADGGLTTGTQGDPSQQVGDNSLAQKLLTSGDSGGTGASRQTEALPGVH